jgi:hypothetical protein
MFRQHKTLKEKRIKFPALLYGSENRTIKVRDARRRITAVDMKYMRKTAGYIWTDYKTNTEIPQELNITTIWT